MSDYRDVGEEFREFEDILTGMRLPLKSYTKKTMDILISGLLLAASQTLK